MDSPLGAGYCGKTMRRCAANVQRRESTCIRCPSQLSSYTALLGLQPAPEAPEPTAALCTSEGIAGTQAEQVIDAPSPRRPPYLGALTSWALHRFLPPM